MDNRSIDKFKKDIAEILGDKKELVEQILLSMDEHRIIQYSSPDEVAIISTPGRVIFAIILDPTMTQRAIAIYLGISETMVEKTIKTLTDKGLITKTKVNRKNIYQFNKNLLLNNADIQRLPLILNKVLDLE
jgi:DNA-binding MarR family transcriptional regulator